MEQVSLGVMVGVVFVCGFGWGQWWTERKIRVERTAMERGRINVSMPVDPEQATSTMRLLTTLMEHADAGVAEHNTTEREKAAMGER